MKLAITTQHRENYGAHDWDGKGECPQYWKNKGGCIYVVPNISEKQAERINRDGIPTLSGLLDNRNEAFEEFVIHFEVVADDAVVCEEWETPIELSYVNGQWSAQEVMDNTTDGYMNKLISRRICTWTLAKGTWLDSDRTCTYVMTNGDIVKGSDINAYLAKAA